LSKTNLAASVRQRLLDRARSQGRPFQELLQYYAMERFLYRLSRSEYSNKFILKGALLLTAWRAPLSRPTVDIDLMGRTSNKLADIRLIIERLCITQAEADGIQFEVNAVNVARIKEDADYEGVRVRFHALLAGARIPMQIDIGFGDVIVPAPITIEYPTLLDFPPPRLVAYPKEAVIAEKLQALTDLGLLNSRLKDYFDIWLLSRLYDFEGASLVEAIQATFRHRSTEIEPSPPGLTDAFALDLGKQKQWSAFLRRSRFQMAPGELPSIVQTVREFSQPPLSAAASGTAFAAAWKRGDRWS
jgi:predicted nucleotidyltransferase component of viral defense system